MTVIQKLASSLNRRDEVPNQELAKQITDKSDKKAVKELIENLHHKSSAIQSDCIKVLYEIGEQKPSLVAEYANEFIALLDHKNNRLQWGAMTALSAITTENPEPVYKSLAKIVKVADSGSVITRDHCVNILIGLCQVKKFSGNAFPLLIEQLLQCPTNQLPMYAEKSLPLINESNKKLFVKTLTSRLDDIDKETKRKRVEKVIRKLS